MRPQMSQAFHLQELNGVSFGGHGIKDACFVLVDLRDKRIGSIIDHAYRTEIPQLVEYNHNQFRFLHESIRRCDGGLQHLGTIWLVMDPTSTTLFKLKYKDAIIGIVTL